MAEAALFVRHHRPSHILVEEKSGVTLGGVTISGLEGKEKVIEVRLIPIGNVRPLRKRANVRRRRAKTVKR